MDGDRPPYTFRHVALDYIHHGGEAKYLTRIIDYFGDRLIADIHPFDIRQMATELYPDHLNSTRNRHALTPVRAVIMHGYERGWCNLMRLRSFRVDDPKKKKPASHMWLHSFVIRCEKDSLPHLAACVLFMSHTGARISEAVALRWSEVDLQSRKVLLLRTKTSRNSERFLTDELVARLYRLQGDANPDDHVFRYSSRWSVNDRIKAVCNRAGLTYKSSHVCGRHSFATNAIALGMDVRTAMEAGGWKSAQLFIQTYVHAKNAGRRVAERFNSFTYDNDL